MHSDTMLSSESFEWRTLTVDDKERRPFRVQSLSVRLDGPRSEAFVVEGRPVGGNEYRVLCSNRELANYVLVSFEDGLRCILVCQRDLGVWPELRLYLPKRVTVAVDVGCTDESTSERVAALVFANRLFDNGGMVFVEKVVGRDDRRVEFEFPEFRSIEAASCDLRIRGQADPGFPLGWFAEVATFAVRPSAEANGRRVARFGVVLEP